ncbi:phenylacetate--CoA ligase family protein [Marinobacter xestospongiae]|uniref:Phenylacetate-CoA ligase n=1 Tax=Marinobacter xestospongiae TaxID=994319 RepID=A0ABU3VZZ6_9GAMM|nr:hypothetical protein [Marinobacter xestospongiae]MDV2079741.1 hypothetical protein [Marinobacter xestospongiae]
MTAGIVQRVYDGSPVWFQNLLVSAYGYNLYRKRYTGGYRELLEQVRRARHWDADEIEAYQSERLHEMVRHCRHSVPYYQSLFAKLGLTEQDFTATRDLTKLPILDKATLRAEPERFRAAGEQPFMIQHTSGSTGTPLALAVNRRTYQLAMALLVEFEEYHGVPFGARRATFAGRMIQPAECTTPPFARFNRAENQMLFSSYHLNDNSFPWYQQALEHFQPMELIGYPSAIADLANHYQQAGTRPGFQPQAVVTNSETLLDWQRTVIESVFGCPVRDYYGTAEYALFAGQDSEGLYRLNPVLGITEAIPDETTGAETATLVATTLTNTTMPLLRYRIGDTAQLPEPAYQPVRPASLARINGRIDDYVETPDGRRIGRLDHIFKGLNGIAEAQIVQDAKDHCTIKVVVQPDLDPAELRTLEDNLSKRTAGMLAITIQQVDRIPRGANGKFRAVIRELSAPQGTQAMDQA